eukprot:jgi/Orpsp1_1/1184614/evm.model.c7180000090269.1
MKFKISKNFVIFLTIAIINIISVNSRRCYVKPNKYKGIDKNDIDNNTKLEDIINSENESEEEINILSDIEEVTSELESIKSIIKNGENDSTISVFDSEETTYISTDYTTSYITIPDVLTENISTELETTSILCNDGNRNCSSGSNIIFTSYNDRDCYISDLISGKEDIDSSIIAGKNSNEKSEYLIENLKNKKYQLNGWLFCKDPNSKTNEYLKYSKIRLENLDGNDEENIDCGKKLYEILGKDFSSLYSTKPI